MSDKTEPDVKDQDCEPRFIRWRPFTAAENGCVRSRRQCARRRWQVGRLRDSSCASLRDRFRGVWRSCRSRKASGRRCRRGKARSCGCSSLPFQSRKTRFDRFRAFCSGEAFRMSVAFKALATLVSVGIFACVARAVHFRSRRTCFHPRRHRPSRRPYPPPQRSRRFDEHRPARFRSSLLCYAWITKLGSQ